MPNVIFNKECVLSCTFVVFLENLLLRKPLGGYSLKKMIIMNFVKSKFAITETKVMRISYKKIASEKEVG